jgi:division protein CdvB (Snf7/Vps24/ESCRT-III family)
MKLLEKIEILKKLADKAENITNKISKTKIRKDSLGIELEQDLIKIRFLEKRLALYIYSIQIIFEETANFFKNERHLDIILNSKFTFSNN